jgi:predicted secreted protein
MANNNVIGKNIMLYNTTYNAKYYFNGRVPSITIGGYNYKQLGTTDHAGAELDFSRAGDGLIAGFITDSGVPSSTIIKSGSWTFQNYIYLSTNTTGTPSFYFKVYKYDGITLTLLSTSGNTLITSISSTLYSTTLIFTDTTISSTDRILIEVYSINIGSRTINLQTEGTTIASVVTTLPNDTPFACSTNCTYSVQVAQKDVTSQTSAWYKEYKNDIATWNITCDGLITLNNYGYLFLLQLQQSRASIFVKFVIDNGTFGLVIISGTCNMTSLQINGPYKDIATYAVSLQGTGAYGLTGTTINSNGIITLGGSVTNKQYTAAGGETTISWTDMIGKTCIYVSRGGIDVREIVTLTPIGEQVSWNAVSGLLTFARALESDEFIRGLFQ